MCNGIFGKLFGHKFEPQYDEINPPSTAEVWKSYYNSGCRGDFSMDSDKFYRGSVCKRCGAVVNQQPEAKNELS